MIPIFIDFTQQAPYYRPSNYLDLDTKDPVDLYTEDLDPTTNTKERMLAPRYYVLIHSPANKFESVKKIDIEKAPHSLNKNQLRVILDPSIGYGINACYRVEYWQWHPLLNSRSTIATKKVHEEYWYVPTVDAYGYYVPNYYYSQSVKPWPHTSAQWNVSTRKYPKMYWPYYYNRVVVKSYIADRVIKGDYVIDTLKSRDALSILFLPDKNDTLVTLKQPDVFKYNSEVKDWAFSVDTYGVRLKRLISGVNGLEGLAPMAGDNITVKVKHYLPFHPSDFIVQETYLEQYIF